MKTYIGLKRVQAEPQEIGGKDGYVVTQDNGIEYWYEKEDFESTNREVDGLTFWIAGEAAMRGKGMRLKQWQPDVIVRAQFPDDHSKMTAPYLYVESRFGKVPWKETMMEMFSENWEIVD